jgi:predicted enzyme related to lactoylglutathione lyase
MLNKNKAFSSFSVDDLEKAKKFYGETLGLNVSEEKDMGLNILFAGGGSVFIYSKPNHQPATFTVLNFIVEDIDKSVDELISRGIKFLQYTGELQTDEKGIARSTNPKEGPSIAWFADPAGNILSILQEK